MKVVLQVSELEIRFILQATSFDLNDVLTFSINDTSMTVTDGSLQHLVGTNPFKISGDRLLLNFNFQDASMRGMFKFNVQMTNLGQFLQYWSLVRKYASKCQLSVFLEPLIQYVMLPQLEWER